MRRRGLIVLLSLALGGACAHTKTTDEGREKKEEEAKQETAAPKATKKPRAAADPAGPGSELHPGEPDAVPVATAPEGLLAPGAEDKIRKRLSAEGFLDGGKGEGGKGSMREGIRRFQKAHDLPATGVADHATVKGLGLDPNEIFRQGTVKD